MMIRRSLFLLLICKWSSPQSSLLLVLISSRIVIVDAKLMLWSKTPMDNNNKNDNDNGNERKNSSPHDIKQNSHTNIEEEERYNTIRHRLKLFHKHDDDDKTSTASSTVTQQEYLLSPAKYLNLMLLYLQSSIQEMTDYLYNPPSSNDGNQSSSQQQQQSSSSSSSAAYALFRQAQYKDMLAEPKDAWEGIVSAITALRTGYLGGVHSIIDGAYELGCGTISACTSLLSGGATTTTTTTTTNYKQDNNNNNPLAYAFMTELLYGMQRGVNHAADGLYLFAAGAVVGTRNLMVGIYRTPEAIRASQLGMMYYPRGRKRQLPGGASSYQQRGNAQDVSNHQQKQQQVAVWDYYSLDYEDAEIQKEEERMRGQHTEYFQTQGEKSSRKDTKRNNVRRRHGVSVKDSKYYDVLGVSTNANPREIRSAYRKEALKRHPDKQNAASSSLAEETLPLPDDPHIEGFLDLTEAYRTLSNDASREAYDQHGRCFREETLLPEDIGHDDYVDLIDELFGANAVRDYVGTVLIAPIVNEMFGFGNSHDTPQSLEVQDLQQRRRVVEIAKFLRERVNAYLRGEITTDEYIQSCRKEASFILQEGGEPTVAFLRVVGKTLLEEANQINGLILPFVKKTFSDSSQKIKSSLANARVYGPIYFRAALEGLVLSSFVDNDIDDPDDCSGGKTKKESVDQDAVLDLLWSYVVNDSVATLRDACEKVFADRGIRDNSLAFVQTPSLIKHQRFKRAEAIKMLAREMLTASIEASKIKSK